MLKASDFKDIAPRVKSWGIPKSKIDREVSFALGIINKSARLLECDLGSIKRSIAQALNIGLSLNPEAQECALIPKRGACTLMPMYQGLAALAFRHSNITQIIPGVVYENDNYEFTPTDVDNPVSHTYSFGNRGKPVGFYVQFVYESGGKEVHTLSVQEALEIRDMSDGWSYAVKRGTQKEHPWYKWFNEMGKKSCFKRAYKYANKSNNDKLAAAIELDNDDFKIQDWQRKRIEYLLPTSTYDDEQKAAFEDSLFTASFNEANNYIGQLEAHQLPNHPGYNDRVNKSTIGKQVAESVKNPKS